MIKRIFVTYHKTGHHLCANIAEAFSRELGLRFRDISRESRIPDDAEVIVYESKGWSPGQSGYRFESYGGVLDIQNLDCKGVHMIRHPYEIIASAYRWHRKIDKPWVHRRRFANGKSYRENLETGDGIAFEMQHVSHKVIMKIYHFPFSDPRFIQVRLEDFETDFSSTIARIAGHLDLPESVLQNAAKPFDIKRTNSLPEYATRTAPDCHSHRSLFQPHHYELFRKIFPEDLLIRLGYEESCG